jgi:hypothetical protein
MVDRWEIAYQKNKKKSRKIIINKKEEIRKI